MQFVMFSPSSNLSLSMRVVFFLGRLSVLLVSGAAALLLVVLCDSSSRSNRIRRFLEDNNHDDTSSQQNEEDDLETSDLTSVACIVLLLIFLTVLFEEGKHRIEHAVSHDKKIIVDRLFGELTVLGFLAMVIFILAQSGVFERLSYRIHQHEEALEETLEEIHYALFCVMAFFVFQIWVLMKAASQTEQEWSDMDDQCRNGQAERRNCIVPSLLSEQTMEALHNLRKSGWYTWAVPQLRNRQDESVRNKIVFGALRTEFLLERWPEYPYRPLAPEKRLPNDFDFGRYLGLCQILTLTHLVELEHTAWLCCAIGTVLFYVFAVLLQDYPIVLAWSWVVIGWATCLFNTVFELHLNEIRDSYLPRRLKAILKQEYSSTSANKPASSKASSLLSDELDPDELPSWCFVEQDQGTTERHSWVFYWMDRGGPKLYMLVLQLNLIFTGVYVACLLLVYYPSVLDLHSVGLFVAYGVLSLLPVLGITYNKKRLVATLTMCLSMGSHRRHHVIADVLLEEKTRQAFQTLLLISTMRRSTDESSIHNTKQQNQFDRRSSYQRSRSCSNADLREAAKIFDHIAEDGYIQQADLDIFFARLGIATTQEIRERMMRVLDVDGDGQVTSDEFMFWYAQNMVGHDSVYDRATEVFALFDLDGDGTLTLSEFKHRADALQLAFTTDEIGAIFQKLDEDRSGEIDFEEFLHAAEKYFPKCAEAAEEPHAASTAAGATDDCAGYLTCIT